MIKQNTSVKTEQPGNITNITKVYEIWQVFLDYNKVGIDSCYIIISGDFKQNGYANGNWDNLTYCGFYTDLNEAENEIGAHLK